MTLLVLGILAIVNFLSVRHQKRVDLTEQQLYSLSEQTRKVLENLETEVEVMGFFRTEPARISYQNFMQEFRYVSSGSTTRVSIRKKILEKLPSTRFNATGRWW